MSKENRGHYKARMEIIAKFRINFLVLYNKDFEKITLFWVNNLATVSLAAFSYELRSNNYIILLFFKDTIFCNTIKFP